VRILFSPEDLDGPLPHPVATVGNFDGVHRGHRRILRTLRERAAQRGGTVVVITFNPHPQKVLHPDSAPRLITTRDQKIRLLGGEGVDLLLELPFTRELAALSPEEFVQRTLLGSLGVEEIHIGRNFRFGHRREGNFATLERLGQRHGFLAIPVTGVRHDDRRISSTRIRHALADGDVALAGTLLGHEEELVGTVEHGDGRGTALGFPTANLRYQNELVPFTGVYVTRFLTEGREYPSVTNIGSRPTFPGAGHAVESHLIGFSGDLYGRQVVLRFVDRLRDERRFESAEELKDRIRLDISRALELLEP
jgi:riboflavin kinase/FMN adenylyltransferase